MKESERIFKIQLLKQCKIELKIKKKENLQLKKKKIYNIALEFFLLEDYYSQFVIEHCKNIFVKALVKSLNKSS